MAAFRVLALRLEEELKDFTLAEVFEKMKLSDGEFEDWLRTIALLGTPRCGSCRRPMKLRREDNMWICHLRECRTGPYGSTKPSTPVKKGSFFDKAHFPLAKIFALSYFWIHNLGLVVDKEYELGIGHSTVVQWEQYFRDICCEYFRRNRPVLGGVGHVVEIDETCVTKRKYNRVRWVRRHQWLFGGYERGSGRSFLILVRRRDARTLLRLIVKYIRPGTTIISDCWRAYNRISTLPHGFTQLTVNHQLHFVDPRSGAHTQNIECHWQKFKSLAKRKYGINNRRYKDYLSEFLWRQQFGRRNEAFYNFWMQVAEFYPVPC
ncbi:hypothetical protein ANCCEY_05864 [Ancylostoma ceylanicum]|uniref:ISXO2-like transposase domain-containing protein n=2 Tax=Ancylostoma ceylanicum TaxID=53326 RepID=A0A0D6LT38_9BILA|nr:hypothetical protein ANCCEY_05864 [Ancylostoma ceylanicum]EYC41146.1 hypothetical protein Y032_0580g249 [Ancylostoma ceylanicum]